MEVSPKNSMCSYPQMTKNVIFFLFKIGEQDGGIGLAWGFGTRGRGKEVGKWIRG
jgi:hypothetical protein